MKSISGKQLCKIVEKGAGFYRELQEATIFIIIPKNKKFSLFLSI
jgi:hypothetical protein